MKLHLPKQLFTALLAAITLAAPAALTLGSSVGAADELGIVKEGNFWANDYTYSFMLQDDAFTNVIADDNGAKAIVLSRYYGSSETGDLGSNALIAVQDSAGTITLKLGRGMYTSASDSFSLDSSNCVSFDSDVTVKTGVVYTLKVTGATGSMTPTLYGIAAGESDTQSSYNGNMNGDDAMQSVFNDDAAILISGSSFVASDDSSTSNVVEGTASLVENNTLVWAGTPAEGAAAWTAESTTWNNISGSANGVAAGAANDVIFDASSATSKTVNLEGALAVNSISVYGDYTLNATAATTLSTTEGLSIAGGKTLTLQGATITLGGTITNNGTLNMAGFTVAANTTTTFGGSGTTTLSGTITNNGTLNMSGFTVAADTTASISGTGTTNLSGTITNNGTLTAGGTVAVAENTTLTVNGTNPEGNAEVSTKFTGTVQGNGKLIVNSGTVAHINDSDKTFKIKNTEVAAGATLQITKTDSIDYGDSGSGIKMDVAGTLDFVESRQTLGNNFALVLQEGAIVKGQDGHGGLDFNGTGGGITAAGNAEIQGALRVRENNVTINVADGKTLTTSTIVDNDSSSIGSIIKSGTGTLKITSMVKKKEAFYGGAIDVQAGEVEFHLNDRYESASGVYNTFTGTISGAGKIVKSGSAALTLSQVTGPGNGIEVRAGSLTINNLTVNRTLAFAISQDETASASLSIGNVTLSSNHALTELDTEFFYVQEKSDSATHTENGFRASPGTYLLFDGFEWNGEIAGYNVTAENSQTKITSTSTVFSDIFYVNQSAEYSDAALFGSTAVEIAAEQGLTLNVAEGTVNNAAAAVTGSGKLIKTGSGELQLNQTGTYTGGTEIQGGILIVNANNALGSGAVTLGAGTTLELRYGVGLTNDISMTDATLDLLNGSGTYNTLNSNITLAGTRNVIKGSCYGNNTTVAGTITGSGVLSLETSTHPDYNTTAATNQWTISSVISGDSLSLVSSANVTLSGANTFKGNVTITGNTLTLGGSSSGISALGETYDTNKDRTITVQNGATLDVKGKEAYYHVVLEDGATLTNSGNEVNVDRGALPYVELRGNASINSSSQMVMKQGGSDSSGTFQLALNGHKLTKTGANMLYLQNVSIGSGTLQIDAGTVKAGTGVTLVDDAALDLIINDGILHTQASLSLNTLTLGANADEVCVEGNNNTLTVTGATSAAGKFSKTGSGILSLEGATTFGGEVYVTNGRLKVTGALTAGAINKTGGGTLELADGSGEKKINGTSSITNGILVITQQDAIDYTATTSMSISGATLQLDARQTVDSENSFTLSSGHITGSGGDYDSTDASYTAGLDIYNESTLTINSSGASSIATGIGLRKESGKVKFNVTADTLTTSGTIAGNGGVLKSGTGELVLSGNNTYTGGTSIEAGTVTAQNASALGTGGVAVSGTGVLSVAENLNLQDTLQLSDAGEVQVATGKSLNLQDKVSLSSTDGTNAATLTAKANVNALAQLQEEASFTIEDMTLTNTTVTAATVETKVKLQNVEGSTALLAKGAFTLHAAPTVGMAPTAENHGTLSYTNGLAIATDANASLTLNLDVVNAVAGDAHGTYDLTITLSGFGEGFAVTEGILDMVGFDSTSWLGQALVSQKAEYTVVTEQTPATTGEGGVPTVSYAAGTGANVGSLVITISGLNVPEPATSTLSLLALAALAARRRRK